MKINIKKKLRKIVNGHTEGFSLIEVATVMVMMGIMTAIALPRLTGFSGVDLYNVAKQVKSDIRYTQESAMSKFRETTITFGTDTNTYAITSSGPTQNKQLPPNSKAIFSDGSTLIFRFNSSGEAITGGGGTLIISSSSVDSVKQIQVSSTTGKAEIL